MWLTIWLLIIVISAYLIVPRSTEPNVAVAQVTPPATLAVASAAPPRAPKAAVRAARPVAMPALPALRDQHFHGCDDARAAGRYDIPSWDPSYRREMDGDGDGLACEPYRGR